MNMKKGTPGFGLLLGLCFVLIGILFMLLGFWRGLLLVALFAIGFFLGSVENKEEVLRDTANRLIPKKEASVIDFKSEVEREQTLRVQEALREASAQAPTAEPAPVPETPAPAAQPAEAEQIPGADASEEE